MFGVPSEELGFRPLKSTVAGQTLGQGPAGLVASPSYMDAHANINSVSLFDLALLSTRGLTLRLNFQNN